MKLQDNNMHDIRYNIYICVCSFVDLKSSLCQLSMTTTIFSE